VMALIYCVIQVHVAALVIVVGLVDVAAVRTASLVHVAVLVLVGTMMHIATVRSGGRLLRVESLVHETLMTGGLLLTGRA